MREVFLNHPKPLRIGVLTSGGDSPGMNACIRSVVRACYFFGQVPIGIKNGYEGLINNEFVDLPPHSVSNILNKGGTILKTARSEEFKTSSGMELAYKNIQLNRLDALIVIGGNGTFTGALHFGKKFNFPIIGIPGTIDNDLFGTEYTVGYDTATNTAIEAIDRIRDTASSHNRLFFVEVMGRDSGYIALRCGIATGAEAVIIPEIKTSVEKIIEILEFGSKRNKTSGLVIVAEGGKSGSAMDLANKVQESFNHYDTKVSILGHIQRGGAPSCFDRVLAGRFGVAAVEGILSGKSGVATGVINDQIIFTPFFDAISKHREMNKDMMRIANILSI